MGIASGPYGTFAVANYEPAGNITNPGYFEKNVLRSGGSVSPAGNSRRRHSSSSSSSSSSDDDIRRQPGNDIIMLVGILAMSQSAFLLRKHE